MNESTARTDARQQLRRFFLAPPRKHGEVDHNREVSFLELFYDLVYVVIVGQAAHHLATHVSWSGVRDFAIVFGLIWLAWFNGTLWHEIHGREDARSRTNIFIQMGLIALMAVYTSHATNGDGPAFATVYLILFAWFTYQWWSVHRIDDPSYHPVTRRYLAGMIATLAAIGASIGVGNDGRLWIWAAVVAAWVIGGFIATASTSVGFDESVTESMVERFGLFTIIVLGEVVIGVVGGLTDTDERSGLTLTVAMLGLGIGMGLWWNYFDALGRRVPGGSRLRLAAWVYAHLPLTAAISAGGAAMISLVEHASDARSPASTAWLLGGSAAITLVSIALATRALDDSALPKGLLNQIPVTLGIGAAAAIGVAATRPGPALLAGVLLLVLALSWIWLTVQYFLSGATSRPEPPSL